MSFSIPIPYSSFQKISAYGLSTITLTGTGVSFDDGSTVTSSYGVTPSPVDVGQQAYNQANTATNIGSGAFNKANTTLSFAQQAFDYANTISGGSAIDNVARVSAQVAFTLANTSNTNLYNNSVILSNYATGAYTTANLSFYKANSSYSLAQQVYDFANTISGGASTDNVARTSAQTAFTLANTSNTILTNNMLILSNDISVVSNNITSNVILLQSVNDSQNNYINAAFTRSNTSLNLFVANTNTVSPSSGVVSLVGINGMSVIGTSNTLQVVPPQNLTTSGSPSFNGLSLTTALPISSGGTGQTSAAGALTALLPTGTTSGYVLTTGGPGTFYWAAAGGGGGGVTPGTTINTTRSFPTVNASQTVFTTPSYVPGASQLRAYINGVRQFNSAYTETSNTVITFNTGLSAGDNLMLEVDGYYVNPYYANNITFTAPFGSISASANTIQLAIQDIETRKATLASPSFTGIATAPTQPQTTSNTTIATTSYVQSAVAALLPSGTSLLFQQSTAPTGWTKVTTHNDKALRVVSGSVSSGGSVAFSSAFASQAVNGSIGSTTLSTSQMPSHTHTFTTQFSTNQGGSGGSNWVVNDDSGTGDNNNIYNNNTGGGGSHNHSFSGTAIDLSVQYVDVIIATKD